MLDDVVPHVLACVPSWHTLSPTSLRIATLAQGLTNVVYSCTRVDTDDVVVIRVYGKGADSYFDRDDESVICQALSERSIGPCIHGSWPEGRCEGFVHGRPLTVQQLSEPRISAQIACQLAAFHSIRSLPLPSLQTTGSSEYGPIVPQTFARTMKWTQEALTVALSKPDQLDALQSMNLHAWPVIIDRLTAFLQSFQSPIVLCHNDLQEGNILFDESVHSHSASSAAHHQHSVQLIDFEYANFSHRGLDLGNHFCEWAIDNNCPSEPTGFLLNSSQYPSHQQRIAFVKHYLAATACLASRLPARSIPHPDDSDFQIELDKFDDTNDEVQRLAAEGRAFQLLSHLQWAAWGVCQAAKSEIAFGFIEYANMRWNEFQRLSAEIGFTH